MHAPLYSTERLYVSCTAVELPAAPLYNEALKPGTEYEATHWE